MGRQKDKFSKLQHEILQQIEQMSTKYSVDKNTITTKTALNELIRKIRSNKICAFDTETIGFSSNIVGISFSFSDTEGYYIPVGHTNSYTQLHLFTNVGNKFSVKDQMDLAFVLKELKPVMEDPEISYIGWNIGYDYRVMKRNGIEIKNIEDAQVMGWLLDENKSRALKDRAKIEKIEDSTLKMSEFCDESNIQKSPIDYVAPYAIQDSCLTWALYQKFIPKLEAIGLLNYYSTVEVPFIFVLSDIMLKGIKIDKDKIAEVKKHCSTKIEDLEKIIYKLCGESFNISSSKQLSSILFEKLGLPIYKRTPQGSPSTDKSVLERLAENGFEVAGYLLEYSQYSKLLSTYLDTYVEKADSFGRVHTNFNQTGTVSGRLASSDPNLQQIPRDKRIRQMFIPAKGNVFVIADYSQLELRVLTHFSQDPVMLDAYSREIDLHTATACKIYEKTAENVSKEERFLAKTVNFSIVYGSGAKPELGITREFIQKWRQAHWGAYGYIRASHNKYMDTGYSRTLVGRFRRSPELRRTKDDGLRAQCLRELFSAHIQGSAADIVKMAMVLIYDRFKDEGLKAEMVIQVHDEIIVECPAEEAEQVKAIMQDCMENALPLKCPLEATPNIGTSWADKI